MSENDASDAMMADASSAPPNAAEAAAVKPAPEAAAPSGNDDGTTSGAVTNDDDKKDNESTGDATAKDGATENASKEDASAAAEKQSGDAPTDKPSASTQDPSPSTNDNGPQSDNSKKRSIEETASKTKDDEGPMPSLPLKRARTAYFIFADEKREEVKKQHQGEGVAAIAKAIGQLWSGLQPPQKEVYEKQSASERARVARDMKRLKDAGLWPEADAAGDGAQDEDAVIFPIGRIRKICKLDPDVKGMSKESALLITKATEMFCTKLGKECVTMAQMQNRRKLMPDDVVEVCSMKERFMFLKPDLIDLRKAQLEELSAKENGKGGGGGAKGAAKAADDEKTSNTLDSYFGKVRN